MFRPGPIAACAWTIIMLTVVDDAAQQPSGREVRTLEQTTERPTAPAPTPKNPAASPVQQAPSEATLGVPLYPGAQFLASYDAGRLQRYFLFGASASFSQVVAYYRTALKQKGDLVFDQPATHMFEIGKFREDTMSFPPSVTIKDYTWGGSEGFLNPRPGGQPSRFPTLIQIVPALAGDLR